MDQDKRRYRQLKRDLKRAGNRRRRRHLQRQLREQPDEAARVDFGRDITTGLNGNDCDATRRRKTEEEDHQLHE